MRKLAPKCSRKDSEKIQTKILSFGLAMNGGEKCRLAVKIDHKLNAIGNMTENGFIRSYKKADVAPMTNYRLYRLLLVALAVLTTLQPAVSAPAASPPDVYRQVQLLSKAVERLRHHMGALLADRLNLGVRDAQPHDVFFQALTLFRKSDRLLFEMTRQKALLPEIQAGVYRPADVNQLVEATRRNVDSVLNDLDLDLANPVEVPARDTSKTPSDVFVAIQVVSRQLNLLLERRFSAKEVYMQVTLAIGYAARQLARFPGVERIPPGPDVEPGRVPSDVFFQLQDCLDRISEIYQIAELPSLEVDARGVRKTNITPGDVFDIASLVVARLDFLHKHFAMQRLPRDPFYPGRVFPTDVYRQAGVLQTQLEQLIERMKPPLRAIR